MKRRKQILSELESDIREHIARETEDNIARGVSPEEARRRAFLKFGNITRIKEDTRSVWTFVWPEQLLQDIRFALRMLRKSPGFTAVAVLTLALGIGANSAIFSLLDGLVLRNLPVPHPEQLVRIAARTADDSDSGLSFPMFQEIARNQKVFSSMFVWEGEGVFNVQINGSLSRADVWPIGGDFYSSLGAIPKIGRLIGPQDVDVNSARATQVAVLGYDYWQLRYGGDPNVIGKTIRIEEAPFTIIGVTRKGFAGMTADIPFQIAIPLTAEPLISSGDADVQKHLQRRDSLWLDGVGRLRPGVSMVQARAQLESLWPSILAATMPVNPTLAERNRFLALRLSVTSGSRGSSYVRGRFSAPLYVLLGISSLVLLIACANLASLLLARGAPRSHEMSVRVALGAGRWRLARQMLTESVVLSVAGASAGLVLGLWGSKALSSLIFDETYIVPGALNLRPDLRMFGFAAVVAVLTGVFFGLAPALRASAENPNSALQEGSRNIGRGASRLGRGLVLAQIAVSLVLLTSAGLFIRSLEKLRDVHPGFRVQGLLDAELYPSPGGYKGLNWGSYYRRLTDKVAGLPGVESVGISHMRPGWMEWDEQIVSAGSHRSSTKTDCGMAMPGFFRTMGIGVLRGRTFNWQDNADAPRVAVVSQNLAEKLFPHGDAIGQLIDFPSEPKWKTVQIVGIVADASIYDVRKHVPPTIYVASIQYGDYSGWSQLMVRTSVAPALVERSIQETVRSLGHEYVPTIGTVAADINHSLLQERITAMLSGFFGVLALLIVGIGLFGLMAYNVARRTRELAIRLALGAQRKSLMRMILRETFTLVSMGLAIGLPCGLAATRVIAHLFFGVTSYDPLTLAIVTSALLAVGTLACYIPARRAMKVDPMVALRYE